MLIKEKKFKVININEEKRGASLDALEPTGRLFIELQDFDDESKYGRFFGCYDKVNDFLNAQPESIYSYLLNEKAGDVITITYLAIGGALHAYFNNVILCLHNVCIEPDKIERMYFSEDDELCFRADKRS